MKAKRTLRRFCLYFILRLVLAYSALFGLYLLAAPLFWGQVTPLLKAEIRILCPDCALYRFEQAPGKDLMPALAFRVEVPKIIEQDGKRLEATMVVENTFPLHPIYLNSVVLLSIILGWPWLPIKERLLGLLVAGMSLFFMISLEIPFRILDDAQPGLAFSEQLRDGWMLILNEGGGAVITALAYLAPVGFILWRLRTRKKMLEDE